MTSRLQRGNQLLVQRRYAEALEEFLGHAHDVPGDAPRALVQAAECLRRTNTLAEPVQAEPGAELVSVGDQLGAEAIYRKALAADPGYLPAMRGLAQVLPDGSEAQQEVLEAALAIRMDTLLVEQLGAIYERNGRVDDARALYARALHDRPNDSQLKAMLRRVSNPAE